ncbi:hypothetical protein SBA6_1280014 [Candidatus Sulfopaludibacter sp. SbA6]|nr:hypothetical protein SBA6_1280014 [Candidatus Sulfopaludibacter sp. SbA6]
MRCWFETGSLYQFTCRISLIINRLRGISQVRRFPFFFSHKALKYSVTHSFRVIYLGIPSSPKSRFLVSPSYNKVRRRRNAAESAGFFHSKPVQIDRHEFPKPRQAARFLFLETVP